MGKKKNAAMANCPFNKPGYPTKRACEQATGHQGERCGRCRQWHPGKKTLR